MNREEIRNFVYKESHRERQVAMQLHKERFKELTEVKDIPAGIKNQICKIAGNVVREADETPFLIDIEEKLLPLVIEAIENMKNKSKTKAYYQAHPKEVKEAIIEILERYVILRKAVNGMMQTNEARRAVEIFILKNELRDTVYEVFTKDEKAKIGQENIDRMINELSEKLIKIFETKELKEVIGF